MRIIKKMKCSRENNIIKEVQQREKTQGCDKCVIHGKCSGVNVQVMKIGPQVQVLF